MVESKHWDFDCRTIAVIVGMVFLTAAAGCAARRVPTGGGGAPEGDASWYGIAYHGRIAADGSRYNMYEFTAAHKTLEFGTQLLVTNLSNGRTVKVKITDRGPFVEGRIIDLSFTAAQALGMLNDGVAPVHLEIIG
ncbi:MAG TPA: septal ring lytic transglycosylase RlpA family protein [Acidobacteriota bacterium]|nr:septal ring lytic transglycosylase RlpA family protein [Acidobacteriota bacterium]